LLICSREEEQCSLRRIHLFYAALRLANVLLESNESTCPLKNQELLHGIFKELEHSTLDEAGFGYLTQVYLEAGCLLELQGELFRFLCFALIRSNNVLVRFEPQYYESRLLMMSLIKIDKFMKQIIVLKRNVAFIAQLVRINVLKFPGCMRAATALPERGTKPVERFAFYCIILPFETVIQFLKLISGANILSGSEIVHIQCLAVEILQVKSLLKGSMRP